MIPPELQWGHDNGVVEDAGRAATAATRLELQWGHDNGVVEDGLAMTAPRRLIDELQWGHDNGVVEDLAAGTRPRP